MINPNNLTTDELVTHVQNLIDSGECGETVEQTLKAVLIYIDEELDVKNRESRIEHLEETLDKIKDLATDK